MPFVYTTNLSEVRALAEKEARAAGLAEDRVVDFVIAVSELAANTVRHAHSPGTMDIWRDGVEIVCEISDAGVIADPLAGRQQPPADATGGHGLWLVYQVCDRVDLHSDASGTVIRLHMTLPQGQHHGQRAERTARMLTELVGVTLNINATETFDGLASAAAAGAARIFSVPAVLFLEMPDGQTRRTSASPGAPGTVRRGGPPGLGARVADHVLAPAQVSATATVHRADWLSLVPDSTLRVDICLGVARTKPDRPPATIAVDRTGVSGDEDLQILRQLAQSVALGVEALRASAEEHLLSLTLQRSFLPTSLPAIPGAEMSFRYLPASDHAEVGGDFYEALPWRDGVLIAIGDVQGHSLQAATVMGELRHALRAFVSEGHPPLAITGLLNEVLRRYHPGIIATLCLVLVEPQTGVLTIVNCGHMPLLLASPGSGDRATAAYYAGEGGLMLGLARHEPHVEKGVLPTGGTALLFTDGMVEDRGVLLDINLEKLRAGAAEAAGTDIQAFANHVMSLFGSREDDVAMIALRRTRLTGAGRAERGRTG